MSNRLEEFIEQNIEDFDRVEPIDVEASWDAFQGKGNMRRRIGWWKPLSIAASIVLAVGLWYYVQDLGSPKEELFIENLAAIDPDLVPYQTMLMASIASHDSTLKAMNVNVEDYEEVYQSIQELDQLTKKYQADLVEYGPDRRIIKSLLNCAKQRVRLYEILLYEIEIKKYHEDLKNQQLY